MIWNKLAGICLDLRTQLQVVLRQTPQKQEEVVEENFLQKNFPENPPVEKNHQNNEDDINRFMSR